MSSRVEDFLIALSQDPYRAAQFQENPGVEVGVFGLSAEEADVLISGDIGDLDGSLPVRLAIMGSKTIKPKKKPKKKKKPAKKKTT
jgi:hypothetical protein